MSESFISLEPFSSILNFAFAKACLLFSSDFVFEVPSLRKYEILFMNAKPFSIFDMYWYVSHTFKLGQS